MPNADGTPSPGDMKDGGGLIAIQATRAGKVIPGVTWRPTNDLEKEIYGIRKGGYHQVPNQSVVKDAGTEYPYKWQSELGIVEVETGNTATVLGQSLYTVFMDDIFDDSPMAGFVSLPVVSGALTEVAMWLSEQSYDIDGNVMPTRPHQHFRIEAGAVAGTRFEFSFRPILDSFVWDVTGDPLNLTKDNGKPVEKSFPQAGVFYRGESALFRRIQYERHDRGTQRGHLLRFAFWQGWTGAPVLLAYFPARLAESKTPAFVIDNENIGGFGLDGNLTGGYHVSQILVATETPREAPLGTTDEIAEGNKAPISSHGVSILLKTVTANQQDMLDRNTARAQAAAAAARYDALLGLWLAGLTDPKGDGVYAKIEDVPEDRRIALVKTASGAVIHYRQEPVAPAAVGALVPLNTYQGAADAVTAAYREATTFVSDLRAAAGSPVSSAELAEIRADINKAEADILTLSKTAGREVAEVASYVIPEPLWPTGLSSSAGGSLMVRKGQVTNVKTTLVNNNSFAGSFVIGQTFGTAERGKSVIARAAVKASDSTNRIELLAQTLDGGSLGQATLAYVNGAWTATGGTVTLDEGWAVLSFAVTFSATANTIIAGGISPGDVQLLAIYDAAKAAYSKTATDIEATDLNTGTRLRLPLDIVARISANASKSAANEARIVAVEGKLDATTPLKANGGDTRSDSTPFITIPDRAGVRFDKLKVTFRDSRKNSAGGWAYPSRTTVLEIPAAWLDMAAVTGRTGWTALSQTFDDPTSTTTPPATITRNSLFRTLSYGGTGARADYDIWLNFRRNADSWDIWFQGQHITTDRKPLNQYCGVYDIIAEYVVDTSAVDPKLKPLTDRVAALEAKPAPDVSNLATTKQLSDEVARAKKAEGDNALAISANSTSIGVVSSSLADETARAKAAEAALAGRVKIVEDRTAPKVAYTPPTTLTGQGVTPTTSSVKGPNGEAVYDVAAAGAGIPVEFDTLSGWNYTLQILVRDAALTQNVRFRDLAGNVAQTTGGAAVNGITSKVIGDWKLLTYTFKGDGSRYAREVQTTGAGAVILLPVLAEPAPASVDLTSYARKKDLAKKQGRVKLWSPEAADLTVTLGSLIEDTAPQFAGSSDIEAKTFTVVPAAPGARPATVKFTATGLVVGQRYELVVEVGSGLVTNFTLAGSGTTTEDVTNWRKHRQIITATATTYASSYTVTHGSVVHGPAVYSLPGLYVQDEALASYQVAEPSDVAAAEARANAVTNFLAQTVQGQGTRISALEARPSGTSPPDPQWFAAERDFGKTYRRTTTSGNQAQSISFDFIAAGSGNVPVSINLPTSDAPISGWPMSGFWNAPTFFINMTPPGGVAMQIAVVARADGTVEIGVGAASGRPSNSIGRVRNVFIDGIAADKI